MSGTCLTQHATRKGSQQQVDSFLRSLVYLLLLLLLLHAASLLLHAASALSSMNLDKLSANTLHVGLSGPLIYILALL